MGGTASSRGPVEPNDPFGMSKFSIRRYSVQHFLLLISILCLVAAMSVYALLAGETVLGALAASALFLRWS